MRYGLACVALVASTACSEAPPSVRVLSYNVNFGVAGDRDALRAIASVDADVVFLQETNPAWESALVGGLQRRYPYRWFLDPGYMPAGGMAVLSRSPIQVDELPRPDRGLFAALRVVVETRLGPIQVLHVHLRPPMSDGGNWLVGYFATGPHRLQEIEQHLARLAPDVPTMIVGDFNEEPHGSALRRCAELGYVDAISTHLGDTPTWHWRAGDETLRLQLDHVLVDQRLRARTARIVEVGRSDHWPIWVDVSR